MGLWGSPGRTASTSRPQWACGPRTGHQTLLPHRRLDRVEPVRPGTGSAAGTLLRRSPDLRTARSASLLALSIQTSTTGEQRLLAAGAGPGAAQVPGRNVCAPVSMCMYVCIHVQKTGVCRGHKDACVHLRVWECAHACSSKSRVLGVHVCASVPCPYPCGPARVCRCGSTCVCACGSCVCVHAHAPALL